MLRTFLLFRDAGGPEPTSGAAPLNGQVDQAQIDAWKAKYPMGIYAFEINGQIGYFKNPNRKEINCALYNAVPESPLSSYEELAKLTFLPGQPNTTMLDDDTIYSSLMACMKLKSETLSGKLVNL
jgi:hypothetical protein